MNPNPDLNPGAGPTHCPCMQVIVQIRTRVASTTVHMRASMHICLHVREAYFEHYIGALWRRGLFSPMGIREMGIGHPEHTHMSVPQI